MPWAMPITLLSTRVFHIADDGIGHQGVGADDTLYDVVEQEDDHAVGELAEAVGGTQGIMRR